jgi:hypothetical protein
MFDKLDEFVAELDKLPDAVEDARDEQIKLLQAEVAKLQQLLEEARAKNG